LDSWTGQGGAGLRDAEHHLVDHRMLAKRRPDRVEKRLGGRVTTDLHPAMVLAPWECVRWGLLINVLAV
jgi:hypothetical protein